ncbi:MAG: hypothetical protein BGO67_02680 [Alphaproteobacteria bacterium 41-28]|nr:MAG: hypothetical protein BGO67_02680 [Alphaproteobacteria bacterium 41-28]
MNKGILNKHIQKILEQYIKRSFENESIEQIIRNVFKTLASRIAEGKSIKLIKILPAYFKNFIAEARVEI